VVNAKLTIFAQNGINFMPEVNVSLSNMTMPGQEFLMDINYDTTYAWATNCTQSLTGVAKSCDLEPSKVIPTSSFGDAST